MDKPRCSKTVFTGERWDFGGHGCTRQGKVQVGAKWFCKFHDPKEEEKRDKAKRERWDQESKARDAKWKAEADREVKRDRCEADKAAQVEGKGTR